MLTPRIYTERANVWTGSMVNPQVSWREAHESMRERGESQPEFEGLRVSLESYAELLK